MDTTPLLSDELLNQVHAMAQEQNRERAEVVEEAVGRYLAIQRLARFAERAGHSERANAIREEDVPRLVDELRRENEARSR